MATDISICNSALVLVGADENAINSFSDSTREARVCAQLYEVTKDTLISKRPWGFTLGQVELAKLVATPLFEYAVVYQLPVDPKLLRVIKTENPGEDYRVFEDKLYTNRTSMKILYQFDPGEENYPPYFVRALELRMAELLALALAQDETFSEGLGRLANRAYKNAAFTDSTNTPPLSIHDVNFALTSVR